MGILFDSRMSFSPHISSIICKTIKALNFIKHNLYKCSPETKCVAYTSLVRPLLEYGAAVWDPYLQKDIQNIEMVQRRAARWVKADYRYTVVSHLCYQIYSGHLFNTANTLATRSKLFYNIVHKASVLKIPDYFSYPPYPTRHHHPLHIEIPFSRTDNYRLSFYPRSIRDWNNLPTNTMECQSLELFLNQIYF